MKKKNTSESIFEKYLDRHGISYDQDFQVSNTGRNVDFFIHSKAQDIYCDVKEVRRSSKSQLPQVYAHSNIQGDIKKLRAKFKGISPKCPVLLVTINNSNQLFTGFTIARAMLGVIGFTVDIHTNEIIKPAHFVGANASLTSIHNRSISGIFVYDQSHDKCNIYVNPYANITIRENAFPKTQIIEIHPDLSPEDLEWLSKTVYL